ncbi:hypothetical protein [Dictyobacter formicarum]|uniref:Uncharacterized protein n=1 Tax=Dictyobacter formicarum TaxID=2778368 RepID=A0ABQ3VPH9_9CHLR|nr:hypothetical protein [Dictyobacter formicarum]GHO88157.1 hypothetical protein KSZ_61630 [Dictyobacter formicarum]
MTTPSSTTPIPRYQIPTHLNVPDKIEIPLFGITISLTMRQGIYFLFGWGAAFSLWKHTLVWVSLGAVGATMHWGVSLVLALVTVVVAMLQVRGRHLEQWGGIMLVYYLGTKVFLWQSVAREQVRFADQEALAQAHDASDDDDEEELHL